MAIRIQREVGGNLAELLLSVAGTLRERDYLRRQVKSLSAEGRFSAYILLALPPGVMLYEYMTNRSYLMPLFTTSMGYIMLGVMVGADGVGGFMMQAHDQAGGLMTTMIMLLGRRGRSSAASSFPGRRRRLHQRGARRLASRCR